MVGIRKIILPTFQMQTAVVAVSLTTTNLKRLTIQTKVAKYSNIILT